MVDIRDQAGPFVVGSHDEAIEYLKAFVKKNCGNAWAIVVEDEGVLKVYERVGNPCLGDMRKYKLQNFCGCSRVETDVFEKRIAESRGLLKSDHKRGHEDYSDPYTGNPSVPSDGYYPGDLPFPFPKGTPLYIGVCTNLAKLPEDYSSVILGEKSPWRRGLSGVIITNGGIISKADIDPTVFVNLLNSMRSFSPSSWSQWVKDPLDVVYIKYTEFGNKGYYTPVSIDPWRFYAGESHDLTGGLLSERFDYNRKILHEVFGDFEFSAKDRTGDVNTRLFDFKAIHRNYFVELKKKDIRKLLEVKDERLQKAREYHEH